MVVTQFVMWTPDRVRGQVVAVTGNGSTLTVKDVGCGQWWWVARGEGLHVDGVASSEADACKAAFDAATRGER